MNTKIGIGVITCNREDFFKQCIQSLPTVDNVVVVNDGNPYPSDAYPSGIEVIQHGTNKCVGVSKNEALRYLMQSGCQYMFLIEDDIIVKDKTVCEQYIKAGEKTGIWHMNFGYHGPANFHPKQYGIKNPRQIVDYGDGIEIAFNPNCVGAFSMYVRGMIKHVGYMDERYHNCWEHVEHTYRIIKAGLHPPFWWFADLANSDKYLQELASSEVNSTIRKTPEWINNMRQGMEWFRHNHGNIPQQIPNTTDEQILEILKSIQQNYAKH